jgi:uncharacterized protein YutD
MQRCEFGKNENGYLALRQTFIQQKYPHMSEATCAEWAEKTRGLIYEDIKTAIDNNRPPLLNDQYNTCEPATGNWVERILPISAYEKIVQPYGYKLRLGKGFYNTDRPNSMLNSVSWLMNTLIQLLRRVGFVAAPFIILSFKKQRK